MEVRTGEITIRGAGSSARRPAGVHGPYSSFPAIRLRAAGTRDRTRASSAPRGMPSAAAKVHPRISDRTLPGWSSPRVRRVPPGVPALPPRLAAGGTRGRILLAGLGLFAEHGFHGTSIRDIAAGAAVQSASLYAHFPSKEAILAELVLVGHEEHHTRLVTALLDSGTDPRDRLAALVRAHVQAHTDYPMLATVANNEMHALSPAAAGPRRCWPRYWPRATSKACSTLSTPRQPPPRSAAWASGSPAGTRRPRPASTPPSWRTCTPH
jgi:AcrR family transcriptional regulator